MSRLNCFQTKEKHFHLCNKRSGCAENCLNHQKPHCIYYFGENIYIFTSCFLRGLLFLSPSLTYPPSDLSCRSQLVVRPPLSVPSVPKTPRKSRFGTLLQCFCVQSFCKNMFMFLFCFLTKKDTILVMSKNIKKIRLDSPFNSPGNGAGNG